MGNKKSLVYKPKEWWKNEVGFDIDKEFLIYQYLCGKLSKRKIKKIDKEERFCRYKSWQEYVEGNLEKYDSEMLNEFYHFLKLNEIECDVDGGMNILFIIPLVVALVSGGLVQSIFLLSTEKSISIDFGSIYEIMLNSFWGTIFALIGITVAFVCIILLFVVFMAMLMSPFLTVIRPYINSKYKVAFWKDYLEITKAVLKRNRKEIDKSER